MSQVEPKYYRYFPQRQDRMPKLCTKTEIKPGYYGMVANVDIKAGQLITSNTPITYIRLSDGDCDDQKRSWGKYILDNLSEEHQEWFDDLYPRISDNDDPIELAYKKLFFNVFSLDTDRTQKEILYQMPTNFNHACIPNTRYDIHKKTLSMKIYALKDIRRDEEITISYTGEEVNYQDANEWLRDRDVECCCDLCKTNDISDKKHLWKEYLHLLRTARKS